MNWHEIRARRNYPQYLVSKKGCFVRLGVSAIKPPPKWLIRFVTGAPQDTNLAPVGRKADHSADHLVCQHQERRGGW